MKYPEYRLSMEAALPSSVQSWLGQELELRGIDSLVYTRYIISMLQQETEDLEGVDSEIDLFRKSKPRARRSRGKRVVRRKISVSEEEKKKFAAIECLSAVTDERSGLEQLVDELCVRLKDNESQVSVSPFVNLSSSGSDSSEESGTEFQNPAERYYAAFPSLHGQDTSPAPSPPTAVDSRTVWRNNPLTRSSSLNNSGEDGSSSSEELKKLARKCPVTYHKQLKPKATASKHEGCRDRKRSTPKSSQSQQHTSGPRRKKEREKLHKKAERLISWPPGYARINPLPDPDKVLDPDCFPEEDLAALEKVSTSENSARPHEAHCTRVESILKGLLLPSPEKTYKELQDVDSGAPLEQRERTDKTPNQFDFDGWPETPVTPREDSVSPELQEQDIWYTQPIDEIFFPQDDAQLHSKLHIYKRNSYPLFETADKDGCILSSASSPAPDHRHTNSCVSDSDSDDIWEGSLLIPAWLTDEISSSSNVNEDLSKDFLPAKPSSLVSSSPFLEPSTLPPIHQLVHPNPEQAQSADSEPWQCPLTEQRLVDVFSLTLDIDRQRKWSTNDDDNGEYWTPTPTHFLPQDQTVATVRNAETSDESSLSVIDLGNFLHVTNNPDCNGFNIEGSFNPVIGFDHGSPVQPGLSSLWHCMVLFDTSLCASGDLDGGTFLASADMPGWQPHSNGGSLSQIWDVNMQRRAKYSPWGSNMVSEGQIWLGENMFVLHGERNAVGLAVEVEDTEKADDVPKSGNTLIPQISFSLLSDDSSEDAVFLDEEESPSKCTHFYDRSVSMGDVPSLWRTQARAPDPKLSKSFELVPSEHSAFYDVPPKLLHVQSEPNLVKFHLDLTENAPKPASPPEHLYFSPKTHFRPITPVNTISELPASKVCKRHDLFGGISSSKTPYQEFHANSESDDEESFVPKFKVKNYNKQVQTGDSLDKGSCSVEASSSECDTPETLTLGMIEDIVNEKDLVSDYLVQINEDLDSAYETDYGISAMESEQYGTKGYEKHHHCHKYEPKVDPCAGDVGTDSSEPTYPFDYTITSFVATYPHTQDWPDVASADPNWPVVKHTDDQMAKSWPPSKSFTKSHAETGDDRDSELQEDACRNEEAEKSEVYELDVNGLWGADLVTEHLYDDGACDSDKYRSIWSAGLDPHSAEFMVDTAVYVQDSVLDNETVVKNDGELVKSTCKIPNEQCTTGTVEELRAEHAYPHEGMYGAEAVQFDMEMEQLRLLDEPGSYFSVKLVYRDKARRLPRASADLDRSTPQQSYGNYDLMPMPDEAVFSTDLEKEWMDPAMLFAHRQSRLQRKPCSFFLEGNCRRADCKFAHDISNITCRFWEEGGCFKGPLCPFLHGYPCETSPLPEPKDDVSVLELSDVAASRDDQFELQSEEFPDLHAALSQKNGNSGVTKRSKAAKAQNPSSAGRREKLRKSNKKSSNKENQLTRKE